MAKELTKIEVRDIIKDELSKFISKELDNEVSTLLTKINSKTRKEDIENIKKGIEKFAEFLYIRRNVWKNDIR